MTMPALFIGHGSPMNALAKNAYTARLNALASELPKPRAILMISAHWTTEGTFLTEAAHPRMIYDFRGFPAELSKVQYPAPGSPELVREILERLPELGRDGGQWGFDHGNWSVLKHLYPEASLPVVQLSLDLAEDPRTHFELGKKLSWLRDEGVLILGSGNLVHNLRYIDWNTSAPAHDWALSFDAEMKTALQTRNFEKLITAATDSQAGRMSVPTPEHYLPVLYVVGSARPQESATLIYEEMQNASISMLSFKIV